jgi:hypothetical protein
MKTGMACGPLTQQPIQKTRVNFRDCECLENSGERDLLRIFMC